MDFMKNACIFLTSFLYLNSLCATEVHVIPSERWNVLWQAELERADTERSKRHYANAAKAYKVMANSNNPTIPKEICHASKERLQGMIHLPQKNFSCKKDRMVKKLQEQEVKRLINALNLADNMLENGDHEQAETIYKEINGAASFPFINLWAVTRLGKIRDIKYSLMLRRNN